MAKSESHTLDVPGAVLHYDVRAAGAAHPEQAHPEQSRPGRADPRRASPEPILLMIGSPMDATGFASLARRFPERTVVTYDPRGAGRSGRTAAAGAGTGAGEAAGEAVAGTAGEATPELHADDLHRLISALGRGPVDVFASSGGAVNALALVTRHPEQVRTLVAHEPPLARLLPDHAAALAAIADIRRTYDRHGFGPAMAKFIAVAGWRGEIPADFADRPAPDPAAFGLPTGDDGSRDDVLFAQNLVTCTHYQPDLDALRAVSTRIVLGVGVESDGEMAHRAGVAVAEHLDTKAVTFPSGHGGFMDGEFGMAGDPDGFAATLRQVLAAGPAARS